MAERQKEDQKTIEDKSEHFDGLLGSRSLIGQWSQKNFEREDSRDFLYEYTQQTDEEIIDKKPSKSPSETEQHQVYTKDVVASTQNARNKAKCRYAQS